jgi:hypothetical protein
VAFNAVIAFISLYGIIVWLGKWRIYGEDVKRDWLPVLGNAPQRVKTNKYT